MAGGYSVNRTLCKVGWGGGAKKGCGLLICLKINGMGPNGGKRWAFCRAGIVALPPSVTLVRFFLYNVRLSTDFLSIQPTELQGACLRSPALP